MVEQGSDITFTDYKEEAQLPIVKKMMQTYLSEPYPVYTYRYFLQMWPSLCIFAMKDKEYIGCIVSKVSTQKRTGWQKGYIAMLAVEEKYRRLGIGRKLVEQTLKKMKEMGVAEAILETETCNQAALRLYESFGFTRDKRLQTYYMNGNDAFRLKMTLISPEELEKKHNEKEAKSAK